MDTEGYAPNILGISIAHPGLASMYFPLGHKEDINCDQEIRDLIHCVLTTIKYRILHHAGHDIIALPDIHNLPFICTMIMGHMIDENMFSKSLDYMAKYYCGTEGKEMHPTMKAIISSMGWEYVPYALMYGYASVDAKITMELFLELKPKFEEQFGPIWTS